MLFKFINLKKTEYCAISKIEKKEIVLQESSKSGLEGSIYAILIELCTNTNYKHYKKFIVLDKNKKENFKKVIKNNKLKGVNILEYNSKEYYTKMQEAQYLITNDSFSNNFVKKEGQIYIKIIDETPLANVGRSNKHNAYAIGNNQRNLIMSDYIIVPNEFTLNLVRKEFMLDNLYKGKYIISGLPKNDIFFNHDKNEKIKQKINPDNKIIIVYAPVARRKKLLEEQEYKIKELLEKLDNQLDNSYIVYVKLNKKTKIKIDFKEYSKIEKIPNKYEFNQILSMSDIFLTDYSSSIFDYSITNKKIISYAYDIENFKNEVGLYFDTDREFEIATTDNLQEIIEQIKKEQKVNTSGFKKYIENENGKSASELCNKLFGNCESKLITIDSKKFHNNKENVIIFTGSLIKNGITSSLKGLINNIDLTKRNYYLTFYKEEVKKNKYLIDEIPKDINYISLEGEKKFSENEEKILNAFFENEIKINEKDLLIIEQIYKKEINRVFPRLKFEYAIDFCGYNKDIINLFMYLNSFKIRYTHSNLKEEYKIRQNIHLESLKMAYKNYDKIIAVREGMENEINSLFPDIKHNNIKIVHNLNNIKDIYNKSQIPLSFEEKTYSNFNINKINEILDDKNIVKFINISRFSKEKGLERLINAFDRFCKQQENKDKKAYLIIIGGHGKEFENICNLVKNMKMDNVVIIKNIQNPLTILKRCDLYILSSYYEGLPMTVMEALILDIPVISVDIEGPRPFFNKGYVHLVEDSEEGIIKGMNDYINGQLNITNKFNANEFNEKAIQEFEQIFE